MNVFTHNFFSHCFFVEGFCPQTQIPLNELYPACLLLWFCMSLPLGGGGEGRGDTKYPEQVLSVVFLS